MILPVANSVSAEMEPYKNKRFTSLWDHVKYCFFPVYFNVYITDPTYIPQAYDIIIRKIHLRMFHYSCGWYMCNYIKWKTLELEASVKGLNPTTNPTFSYLHIYVRNIWYKMLNPFREEQIKYCENFLIVQNQSHQMAFSCPQLFWYIHILI